MCLLTLALGARPAWAQKTDVVVMVNGDRVTCEIKKLDRGILEAKTDSWGTLSIEWVEVARVSSPSRFEIYLRSGQRATGTLGAAPDSGHVVVNDGSAVSYAIEDIVLMKPVGNSFWRQLEGSVDLGYSFASSGDATQWSASANVIRRRPGVDTRVSGDSFFTSKEGADDSSRHSLYVDAVHRLSPRWGLAVMGQAQSNDELLLRLRAQAGAGLVHHLHQSNSVLVSASGGVVYGRELFTDETPSTSSVELSLGSQVEWFVFNSPKTQVTNYFTAFPNLTTPGRVRLELNTGVRRELVKDFFINLSFVDSYDNRPPSEDARSNDLTLVTSLGWSF
jgi:hypothetical protein